MCGRFTLTKPIEAMATPPQAGRPGVRAVRDCLPPSPLQHRAYSTSCHRRARTETTSEAMPVDAVGADSLVGERPQNRKSVNQCQSGNSEGKTILS